MSESTLEVETMPFNDMGSSVTHRDLPVPLYKKAEKRVLDIIFSFILILVFFPLILLVTIIIKMDGGPVLFMHRRIGAEGKSFLCFKFRTMVQDAEARLQHHLQNDPDALAEWQQNQKLKDDPRITRFGRFLRRSSLDELPQLFNVMGGSMSLVGPRPIISNEIERYDRYFYHYRRCRPGLTGLWQVSRHADMTYKRRVELDCLYVAHWSIRVDLIILLRTIFTMISARGAF